MAVISWSDELSVGVHVIDADHKMIIDLINQLADEVDGNHDADIVGSVLSALYDYTDFHFCREEALMEACGYEALPQHRKVHDALRGRVREIRDLHAANPTMILDEDLMEFMTEWLIKHIMGHDKNYAPDMKGKERQIAEAHRAFIQQDSMAPSADATE